MGQYSEGWITVPGKGKKWRTSEGKYSDLRPGFGSQTLGGIGTAISNVFRPVKQRAFPDTFREEYDKDGAYVKPDRSGGFYGPGGNPSGSGMGQAQQTPGIGPYQGHTPGLPRPSQPKDERTTTNGNGVTQTMKAMSSASTPIDMNRSFNDLLNTVAGGRFASNQLPTTAGSPDAGVTPKTKAILAGIQAGKETDMSIEGYQEPTSTKTSAQNGVLAGIKAGQQTDRSIDGYKGQNYTTIQPDDPQFAAAFGQDLADRNTKAKTTGYTKGGRLDQALEGVKTQEANREMTDERRQLMARAAFLDADNSMDGLRAKEKVNGVVYAGGNHYVAGKSGDDKAVKISRDQARSIANNEDTASNISSSELKAQELLKKKSTEIVAATKQSPTVLEEAAKTQAFTQDKPQYGSSTPDIGGKIEFEDSNPGARPGFGNTGGFKSGFKRIDTSMTNPFG